MTKIRNREEEKDNQIQQMKVQIKLLKREKQELSDSQKRAKDTESKLKKLEEVTSKMKTKMAKEKEDYLNKLGEKEKYYVQIENEKQTEYTKVKTDINRSQ